MQAGISADRRLLQRREEEQRGEGLPNPSWELRRTKSASIEGLQRFAVIVRAVKHLPTIGIATLRATVERRRFGLLAYRIALPDSEPLRFEVP